MIRDAILRRALDRLGRRPIVVVTDRYPPHAHGGAEVSLHIYLKALRLRDEVLVVAFGDRIVNAETYEVDGVSVLLLPRQAGWPLQRAPLALTLVANRLPRRARHGAMGALRRTAATTESYADPRDRRLALALLREHKPRGGPVVDFLEYPGGLAAAQLRIVLERMRPEIVHADNFRSILAVAQAARGLDVRAVGVVRDNRFHCVRYDQSVRIGSKPCGRCGLECAEVDLPSAPELQRESLRRTTEVRHESLRAMDRVIVTSQYLSTEIGKIVHPSRLVCIPNTPDEYTAAREHMRGVAELPGTNLLIVGMLNENKGQLPLVAHLAQLTERVPDAVVHFAGRGERIERKMRELAARIGLEDRLVFHGYVDRERLYELYRECQIVLLPTVWPEPFGRVPLEAAIASRPIVAFAVGGLRETIVDGETGLLVRPGDFGALTEAVGRLADDPVLQRTMGARACEHVLRTYSIDALKSKLARTWDELRAPPSTSAGEHAAT